MMRELSLGAYGSHLAQGTRPLQDFSASVADGGMYLALDFYRCVLDLFAMFGVCLFLKGTSIDCKNEQDINPQIMQS